MFWSHHQPNQYKCSFRVGQMWGPVPLLPLFTVLIWVGAVDDAVVGIADRNDISKVREKRPMILLAWNFGQGWVRKYLHEYSTALPGKCSSQPYTLPGLRLWTGAERTQRAPGEEKNSIYLKVAWTLNALPYPHTNLSAEGLLDWGIWAQPLFNHWLSYIDQEHL